MEENSQTAEPCSISQLPIRMGNQGMTRLLVLYVDIGIYKDFTFPIQHPALFHRTETEEICLIQQMSSM